jgi:Na+/H+ antiporter NhaD/arsenite permease-like protein
MSSTFAGNLTILGSVANLIVIEKANGEGTKISFWEYCGVRLLVTLLTLIHLGCTAPRKRPEPAKTVAKLWCKRYGAQ